MTRTKRSGHRDEWRLPERQRRIAGESDQDLQSCADVLRGFGMIGVGSGSVARRSEPAVSVMRGGMARKAVTLERQEFALLGQLSTPIVLQPM